MPKTIRKNDTVNYMTHDGQQVDAKVTNVDNQDQADLIIYHQGVAPTVVNNAARATTEPPAVGTWHKEA